MAFSVLTGPGKEKYHLIGLLKKYQGKVSVLGRDLQSWGKEYYEKIGVSFEMPNHYQKLTALENLEFFRSLFNGKTEDPLKMLNGWT